MPITLELIQRTRIGLIVNNLRKSIQDEEVGSLSKSLIKSWKKLLEQKESKSGGGGTGTAASSENGSSSEKMIIDGNNSSESSQSKSRYRL